MRYCCVPKTRHTACCNRFGEQAKAQHRCGHVPSSWHEYTHHEALPTWAQSRTRRQVTCQDSLPYRRDNRTEDQLVVHMTERFGAPNAPAFGDVASSWQWGAAQ
eukprot:4894304-Pyramimonas_sp.AAC.1